MMPYLCQKVLMSDVFSNHAILTVIDDPVSIGVSSAWIIFLHEKFNLTLFCFHPPGWHCCKCLLHVSFLGGGKEVSLNRLLIGGLGQCEKFVESKIAMLATVCGLQVPVVKVKCSQSTCMWPVFCMIIRDHGEVFKTPLEVAQWTACESQRGLALVALPECMAPIRRSFCGFTDSVFLSRLPGCLYRVSPNGNGVKTGSHLLP